MKTKKKPGKLKQFFSTFFSLYMAADLDITSVAVAYYLIVSVFPILMLLASLLPYFQFDVDGILNFLEGVFPAPLFPRVSSLISTVLTKPSSSWLGISIVTTLWTISRSMSALQKAVNKAYGVTEHRDLILSHLIGIFLGIGLQIILTLGVMMVTFGNTALRTLHRVFDFQDGFFDRLAAQSTPVAYIVLFLALVMLYFFSPNVRIRKVRFVIPGAIFVMVVMGTIGKLFAIYIENYAARLMDFRFVTSVIILVLMLWFVFMANIVITGAVLNATVQSLFVEEFYTRDGNLVSIFRRIKAKLGTVESKEDQVEELENE